MIDRRSRTANGWSRALAAGLLSTLLASCTTAGDQTFGFVNPSLTEAETISPTAVAATTDLAAIGESDAALIGDESPLPDQVALLPSAKPDAAAFPADGLAASPAVQVAAEAPQPEAGETLPVTPEARPAVAEATETDALPASPTGQVLTAAPQPENQVIMTNAAPSAFRAAPAKKRSLFSSLFGSSPAQAAPRPEQPQAQSAALIEPAPAEKPLVQLASIAPTEQAEVTRSAARQDMGNALPGVRQTALFEIKRKSGLDDDSDVDLHEEEDGGPYEVASAAGLARLAPNGLLKQTERVDVGCLKPSLVRMLRQVESHYGKKMVVTSGYRSPSHNRRARGAKNSQHMYCAAADVQIPGVSKWELASYVRTLPQRGGVGTYCHTNSVHIDVGPERDWNWRCRRRSS